MSLLTLAELRPLVKTGLTDAQLQTVIDREEAEIVARYGAHYDGSTTVAETVDGGTSDLFLKRRVASVSSITEALALGGVATTLTSTQYHLVAAQGRVTRLPEGQSWGRSVVVTYLPADDRPLRRQVLIELIRLALEQTAMESENVAGEYSYQAPDWEKKRSRLCQRLSFPSI